MVGVRIPHIIDGSEAMRENRTGSRNANAHSRYLNTMDPVFVLNKKGEIIAVNNAFCQTIGRAKEEIVGLNIGDAYFLTEGARKKANYRHVFRLLGKETPAYTLDVITKNGTVLSLEIDTEPHIKNGKVAGEIGIVGQAKKNIREKAVEKQSKRDNTELLNAVEKIREKNGDIRKIQSELDKASTELDLHREVVREKELQETSNLRIELEQKQQELESMRIDLEARNNIISQMKKQLLENQPTLLIQKTQTIDQLQIELEKTRTGLTRSESELQKKIQEINELQVKLQEREPELESIRVDLETRNNIIKEMTKQLMNNQMAVKEKTSRLEDLQTELEWKEEELETRNNIIAQMKKQLLESQPTLIQKTQTIDQPVSYTHLTLPTIYSV